MRRRGVGTILFRRLIAEARAKGYKILRITTRAENHAMRALAGKFGAHLAFRDGEAAGTIDLTRQPQAEPAKLASAPFAGTRAVVNFNHVYWTLLFAGVCRDAKDFIAGFRRSHDPAEIGISFVT